MTFPTRVTSYHGQGTSVNLPADVQTGDYIVVVYSWGNGALVWDDATAGPWTVLENIAFGKSLAFVGRDCDGGEGNLTLTISPSGEWALFHFRGPDAASVYSVVGSGQVIDPPNLNPDTTTADTFWIAAGVVSNSRDITSIPGGYTLEVINNGAFGFGCGYRTTTAASENPGVFGISGAASGVAGTMGLRMAEVQTLAPSAFTMPFSIQAPQVNRAITAPALSMPFSIQAPNVAQDKIAIPPALTMTFGIQTPTILANALGPPALSMPFDIQAPVVIPALVILSPPALTMTFALNQQSPIVVVGGARSAPTFTNYQIGPAADTAFSDLAIYSDPSRAQLFANIWELRGPIGYKTFAPLVAGEYSFSDAYVWLRLQIPDGLTNLFGITRDKVNVDVPDVVDSATVAVASGGAWINFGRTFYAVPKVVANVVTASGVNTVPRVTIRDDVSKTRFWATIHYGDDMTNTLAGTIHYVASGY